MTEGLLTEVTAGLKQFVASNPSGSRPNFFGRQHLTFNKGGKFSAEQGIVRIWKGWGGARGLLFFCNGCGNGKGRCNGRGKPAPLRKASGIVQM